jgi:hypothetical protein
MLKKSLFVGISMLLVGCVAPPANEMERQANRAAGAEYLARNCGAYVGGFSAARDLRTEANQRVVAARSLGATDADLERSRQGIASTFAAAAMFTSHREACNALLSELAWSMG